MVQPQEAAATENGFGTDIADLAFDQGAQLRFTRAADRQVDVAALARHGHPAVYAKIQQGTDAKPGPRADYHRWPVAVGLTLAHGAGFARLEPGHTQRHGAEIIDQQQLVDLQGFAERLTAQPPVAVGEAKLVAADRPGPGQ